MVFSPPTISGDRQNILRPSSAYDEFKDIKLRKQSLEHHWQKLYTIETMCNYKEILCSPVISSWVEFCDNMIQRETDRQIDRGREEKRERRRKRGTEKIQRDLK